MNHFQDYFNVISWTKLYLLQI